MTENPYSDFDRRSWVADYLVGYHHMGTRDAQSFVNAAKEDLRGEPLNVLGKFVRSFAVITQDLARKYGRYHTCNQFCNTIE